MIYTTSTFLELAQKSSLCIGISGCVVVCHLNILVRVTHTSLGRDILSNDTVSHCPSPPPHHQLHLQESSCTLGRWQTSPSSVAASLKYGTKLTSAPIMEGVQKARLQGPLIKNLFTPPPKKGYKAAM